MTPASDHARTLLRAELEVSRELARRLEAIDARTLELVKWTTAHDARELERERQARELEVARDRRAAQRRRRAAAAIAAAQLAVALLAVALR